MPPIAQRTDADTIQALIGENQQLRTEADHAAQCLAERVAEVDRLREQNEGLYAATLQLGRHTAALRAQLEELAPLADYARLLGPARMVLDRCAELAPGYQAEAADMAQRIVDLIGHPVTDEPPHALVELAELRERVGQLEAENGQLWDAVEQLWAELPADIVLQLRREQRGALVELAQHAHHRVAHEQRMVRRPGV